MTRTLRRLFATGALSALAVSLSACGPDDAQHLPATNLALADTDLQDGWDMSDLAGVDPAFLGERAASLPEALPMPAAYDGGYAYAPSYDYAPQLEQAHYVPLDEGAYAEDGGTDDYALLALAAALTGMLGDSPPDYGFGYDGVEPWAWETGDSYRRYAEPVDGGYRYYYYEPEARRPFLVSDPYYSYGYRGDRLVAVYDRHGRLVDARRAERQRLAARTYYARADRLHRASHRRFGVPAPLWERERSAIEQDRRDWEQARERRADWQRWDAQNRRRLQRDWADEALVRREAERRFDGWQRADYRTPAPEFYTRQAREEQLRRLADLRHERAQEGLEEQRRARRLAEARQEAERRERARDLAQQREARDDRRELIERRERAAAQDEGRRQRQIAEARETARAEAARKAQVQRLEGAEQRAERERQQAAAERRKDRSAAAAEAERQRKAVAAREARQEELATAREAQRERQAAARRQEQQRQAQAQAKNEQQQAAALARKEEQRRLAEAKREQARLAAAEVRQAEAARQRAEQAEARRQAQQEEARAQAAEARRAQQAEARAAQQARQQAAARKAQAAEVQAAERAGRQAEQQQARREAARQEAAQARQQAAQERREAAERARPERPAPQDG